MLIIMIVNWWSGHRTYKVSEFEYGQPNCNSSSLSVVFVLASTFGAPQPLRKSEKKRIWISLFEAFSVVHRLFRGWPTNRGNVTMLDNHFCFLLTTFWQTEVKIFCSHTICLRSKIWNFFLFGVKTLQNQQWLSFYVNKGANKTFSSSGEANSHLGLA